MNRIEYTLKKYFCQSLNLKSLIDFTMDKSWLEQPYKKESSKKMLKDELCILKIVIRWNKRKYVFLNGNKYFGILLINNSIYVFT